MDRRQFILGAAGSVAATGGVRGETESNENSEGTYTEIDSELFPSAATIAWITDRFVQVHAADSPAVGHDIETTGLVLETVSSIDEHEALNAQFDWTDLDYTGENVFSALLSAVSWPLDGSVSFPEDFFEEYELVWLSGVTGDFYRSSIMAHDIDTMSIPSDRLFYSIYGHTPFVFATVPADQSPDPGSVVDLSGAIRHTGEDDSDLDGTPGGYLAVEQLHTKDVLRTPNAGWNTDDGATFTGLQKHFEPTLTSATTDVEYSDDLPRPTGGSVVTKQGTVTEAGEANTEGGTEHELDSLDHEILVGDTLPYEWNDESEPGEAGLTTGPVNISLVVDTSGSMSERDTGREHPDGTTKTRLEALQEDLIQVVDMIEEDYRVSLVEFNSSASLVEPLTEFDDDAREQFKESAVAMSAGGMTTIGGGMERGLETMIDEPGPKTMILLSDGAENQAPYVDGVLPDFRNEGIPVYTIGIGAAIDEAQLEYIADQTGGQSQIDLEVDDLRKFYFDLSSEAQLRSGLSRVEGELDEGDRMEDDCQVDSSCEDAQFSMSYEGSDMDLIVVDPDGNELTEGDGVNHREGNAHEVWSVDDPTTGEWHYEVAVNQVDAPQETFAQSTADSTVDGDLFVSTDLYEATGYVRLQLVVSEGLERYTGASAHAEIIPPGGDENDPEILTLYDDGSGPDDVAGDGIYSNYYHPTEAGEYEIRTVVEGGEYTELRREFTHAAEIETVIDEPIQPWEDRSSDVESPAEGSFFSNAMLAGLAGSTALGAGWWYYQNAGDEATEPGDTDEIAAASAETTVTDEADEDGAEPDDTNEEPVETGEMEDGGDDDAEPGGGTEDDGGNR